MDVSKILVTDEIAYTEQMTLEGLDKQLYWLKSEPRRLYEWVHIIFIGDFHQIVPGINVNDAIYSNHFVHLYQLINIVFFLQSDRRFVDNP